MKPDFIGWWSLWSWHARQRWRRIAWSKNTRSRTSWKGVFVSCCLNCLIVFLQKCISLNRMRKKITTRFEQICNESSGSATDHPRSRQTPTAERVCDSGAPIYFCFTHKSIHCYIWCIQIKSTPDLASLFESIQKDSGDASSNGMDLSWGGGRRGAGRGLFFLHIYVQSYDNDIFVLLFFRWGQWECVWDGGCEKKAGWFGTFDGGGPHPSPWTSAPFKKVMAQDFVILLLKTSRGCHDSLIIMQFHLLWIFMQFHTGLWSQKVHQWPSDDRNDTSYPAKNVTLTVM